MTCHVCARPHFLMKIWPTQSVCVTDCNFIVNELDFLFDESSVVIIEKQ